MSEIYVIEKITDEISELQNAVSYIVECAPGTFVYYYGEKTNVIGRTTVPTMACPMRFEKATAVAEHLRSQGYGRVVELKRTTTMKRLA